MPTFNTLTREQFPECFWSYDDVITRLPRRFIRRRLRTKLIGFFSRILKRLFKGKTKPEPVNPYLLARLIVLSRDIKNNPSATICRKIKRVAPDPQRDSRVDAPVSV